MYRKISGLFVRPGKMIGGGEVFFTNLSTSLSLSVSDYIRVRKSVKFVSCRRRVSVCGYSHMIHLHSFAFGRNRKTFTY